MLLVLVINCMSNFKEVTKKQCSSKELEKILIEKLLAN
jgi:hypothetical protein